MRGAPLLLLLALPLPTAAQEIIVTGRGLDAPPGDAAYAVAEIDRERIEESASGRIEDVLRDVAGIAQFRRADSRSSHPTAQGISLRGIGGNASSRALLVLDGVPQADPFGGWVPFPAYLPQRLAGIRVTRGGGSGYHGAGALVGTVELTSASADELGPLALTGWYGSRESIDLVATGGTRLGAGEVTVAAQFARGDGFTPTVAEDRGAADRAAPYRQASLALRGVASVASGVELQTNLSAFADSRERGTAFTPVDSKGTDASLRLVGRGTWRWSALAFLQHRDFSSGFASVDATRDTASAVLDQHVPASGHGARIEIEPPLGSGVTLRIGADLRSVRGRTQELYSFVAGSPTRRRSAGGASDTTGAFADLSVERGDWTLSGGGRIDRWAIRDGSLFEAPLAGGLPLTDTQFSDRSGWEASGRAGVAWRADDAVTLRAAGYTGWRLPTLNELYRPFRAGTDATAANALLDPERLRGVEIGVDLTPATGLSLRATGFLNRLDNAIGNVTLATGPGSFPGVGFVPAGGAYRQRLNLDAIDARGVEIDLRWQAGPWRARASWAYTDARVKASGAAAALDGMRPAQTAPHQLSASLGYRGERAGGSVTARYAAAQFEDDLNGRALADALTFDARLSLPLTERFGLELRGENLTDTQVETGVSGTGVVERATPRTLWIGLSLVFG
ncbi:TonB-dependent receptor [Sphingomonas suaedae]|uniref:TonB-dependent receptor n=1 Tax=Sphingomonas suaedae TaxID=2599297 RepID=A0A518RIC2_9SPHN|nr:TonB-dependent receptor [Sphingomonas suaedae]QDX27216.1 TonB-dependent receptor [Sphingomonas suaedae]